MEDKILSLEKLEKESWKQRKKIYLLVLSLVFFSSLNMISTRFYSLVQVGTNIFELKSGIIKHLIWIVIGLILMVFFSKLNYKISNKRMIRNIIILVSFFLYLILFIGSKFNLPFVLEINGATEWISIKGFRIQISEVLKIPYIAVLSGYLHESYLKTGVERTKILLKIVPFFSVVLIFIFLQRDLGTAIHYTLITLCMLTVSVINKKYIKRVVILGIISIILLLLVFYFKSDITGDYRVQRLQTYVEILLKGKENDLGNGYQVIQSMISIGSGGLLGKGYGNGIGKYKYLPEIHTDFIFSSFAEEWGFITVILVIFIYLLLFIIILNIAKNIEDYFGKYLVVGLVSLIFTQVLLNLYVVTGLMPVTGLPLPLFSYGGASMLVIFSSLGIILNINRNIVIEKIKK